VHGVGVLHRCRSKTRSDEVVRYLGRHSGHGQHMNSTLLVRYDKAGSQTAARWKICAPFAGGQEVKDLRGLGERCACTPTQRQASRLHDGILGACSRAAQLRELPLKTGRRAIECWRLNNISCKNFALDTNIGGQPPSVLSHSSVTNFRGARRRHALAAAIDGRSCTAADGSLLAWSRK
jgi:hypothetical protein